MWLGKLSYSLYLWQQLFCIGASGWAVRRFPLNLALALAAGAVPARAASRLTIRSALAE